MHHQSTDKQIWLSLRQKEFNKKTRAFLWKAMHDAFKCGKYWRNIPNYEHCSRCVVCGKLDSIEHVLTQCKASGQKKIWCQAKKLWMKDD